MPFWTQRAKLAAPPTGAWCIWWKVYWGKTDTKYKQTCKGRLVCFVFVPLMLGHVNILLLIITNLFIIRGEREEKEKWKLGWLRQSKQPYPALYVYFMFIPSHYFPVINLVFVSNFKWVICCFVLCALGHGSCLSMAYSLYLRRDFLIKAVKCLWGLERTNK